VKNKKITTVKKITAVKNKMGQDGKTIESSAKGKR
jgi:hypothetical protein